MSSEKKETGYSPPPGNDYYYKSHFIVGVDDDGGDGSNSLPPYTANNIEHKEHSTPASNYNNNFGNRFNIIEGTRGAFKSDRRRKCCCCHCPPCCLWCCGIFWCVIILVLIILAIIVAVNVRACKALSSQIDTAPVTSFTYDPNIYTTFRVIDSHNTFFTRKSNIIISQSNTTATNVTVNVSIAATKGNDVSFNNGQNSADTYELSILRSYDRGSMMNTWWSWSGYMVIPTRCIISKVQMIIPQNLNKSTAVQANNYDVLVTNNPIPYTNEFKTSTHNGNIYVKDLIAQTVTLETTNGDIISDILNATNATFDTSNGNILVGRFGNLENVLNAHTTNGNLKMDIDIPIGKSPSIDVSTTNGDVFVIFNSTFSGSYDLSTTHGKVTTSSTINTGPSGKVGNGTGNLKVRTTNGDIKINF